MAHLIQMFFIFIKANQASQFCNFNNEFNNLPVSLSIHRIFFRNELRDHQ